MQRDTVQHNNMEPFWYEVQEQPDILARLLERWTAQEAIIASWLRQQQYDRVLITGMGGSWCAAYPAYLHLTGAGLMCQWIETAELLHFLQSAITPRTLLVAVSQSGESVELVRLLEHVPHSTPILAVTNSQGSSLARRAGATILLEAGEERTVSTKTYTASLLALHLLARTIAGREEDSPDRLHEVPTALQSVTGRWREVQDAVGEAVAGTTHLFAVGRGPSLATAMAAGLTLKEGGRIPAEGMSVAAFRHGPVEALNEQTGILVFAPTGSTYGTTAAFAEDMGQLGAKVVLISDATAAPHASFAHVHLPVVGQWLAPVLEAVPVQLLIRHLAMQQGREPGVFRRIEKVTRME